LHCNPLLDCKYSRDFFTPDYLVGYLVYHCANEHSRNSYTQVLFLPVKITVTDTVTITVDALCPLWDKDDLLMKEKDYRLKLLQISYFKIQYAVVFFYFSLQSLFTSPWTCPLSMGWRSYTGLLFICSHTVTFLICFLILIHFQIK